MMLQLRLKRLLFTLNMLVFITGCRSSRGDTINLNRDSEEAVKIQEEVSKMPMEEVPVNETSWLAEPAGTIVEGGWLEGIAMDQVFYQTEISDTMYQRIYGKSFKEDCTILKEDLRYIRVLHIGFDQRIHIGELIVNKEIAEEVIQIFVELYQESYPIEKIHLIDDYDADDNASMADNNTSCFNFRKVSGSNNLSKHARGLAIDVNPLYNPYLREVDGEQVCEPLNGWKYAARDKDFSYKIDESDLCYQLFTEKGFQWGGSWNRTKDYQHFQKDLD